MKWLKFIYKYILLVIIQLLVCSELEKDLQYFTFDDLHSTNAFNKIINLIEKKNMSIQTLYKNLINYGEEALKMKSNFSFIDYLINNC